MNQFSRKFICIESDSSTNRVKYMLCHISIHIPELAFMVYEFCSPVPLNQMTLLFHQLFHFSSKISILLSMETYINLWELNMFVSVILLVMRTPQFFFEVIGKCVTFAISNSYLKDFFLFKLFQILLKLYLLCKLETDEILPVMEII